MVRRRLAVAHGGVGRVGGTPPKEKGLPGPIADMHFRKAVNEIYCIARMFLLDSIGEWQAIWNASDSRFRRKQRKLGWLSDVEVAMSLLAAMRSWDSHGMSTTRGGQSLTRSVQDPDRSGPI